MGKTTLKSITKRLDAITRKIVLARDRCCVTCGSHDNPQVAHYISRSHISTRWDLRNCNIQCSRCHLKDFHGGFVSNYQNYLKLKHGKNIIEELEQLGRKLASDVNLQKLFQREDLYKELKVQLSEYE